MALACDYSVFRGYARQSVGELKSRLSSLTRVLANVATSFVAIVVKLFPAFPDWLIAQNPGTAISRKTGIGEPANPT